MRNISLCLVHSIYSNNRHTFLWIFLCSEAVIVVMVALGTGQNNNSRKEFHVR